MPDGTLLSRDAFLGRRQHSLTEYRGNAVYQDSAPKYLLFDGGLIDMAGNTPNYQFFIKDHLGSTRVVATAFGQVLQSNEYYPYGETIEHNTLDSDIPIIDGPIGDSFDWPAREPVDTLFDFEIDLPVDNEISLAQSRQPYKFSGKEFMTSHGINQYNFGARYYDPALCRFTTMDPLAEKYYSISPYAYCNNNPVIFVDPDGRDARNRVDASKKYNGKPYEQEVGDLRTSDTESALAKMDCSEYVSRILADDGIINKNVSYNTTGLANLFADSNKFSRSDTPQIGDVALWKGHCGLVTSVNQEGLYKLSHARGQNKLSGENLGYTTTPRYSGAPFLGFFHPRDEDKKELHVVGGFIPASTISTQRKQINIRIPNYVETE